MDWRKACAASRIWLGDVRDDWLGQARYFAPGTTERGVGPKVWAGAGYYWVRLLTPAAFIEESRMMGERLWPVAGFGASFPPPDDLFSGVWSLRDRCGHMVMNVELLLAAFGFGRGNRHTYEIWAVNTGSRYRRPHRSRLDALSAHVSAMGCKLDLEGRGTPALLRAG